MEIDIIPSKLTCYGEPSESRTVKFSVGLLPYMENRYWVSADSDLGQRNKVEEAQIFAYSYFQSETA